LSQRIGFLLLDIIAGDLHVVHEGCMSADQSFVVEADMGELMEEGEPKIICPIIAEGM